ncbi:unnamed protein product [[Candida] boidinii]|uniref:Unnamed protein product n=1 Tax=Candida boidinii TaxID=5477 RepID=A0ACB5TP20_CANBO|nr:unnamed protein product [[Candida] boidinii]
MGFNNIKSGNKYSRLDNNINTNNTNNTEIPTPFSDIDTDSNINNTNNSNNSNDDDDDIRNINNISPPPYTDYENNSNTMNNSTTRPNVIKKTLSIFQIVKKYFKYIGPGLMVSVAYMDPGNYSTAVSAGSHFQYKLLFSVLLANIMAAFLQILCAKLGSVSGLDLAANCREHLPRSLNIFIYILAEIAIIATDLAEVVGTAIALNILFSIPLLLGVILTVVDVLIVLMAYRPNGPLLIVRIFEGFVGLLVTGTVICFAIELADVSPTTNWGDVFKGFLPSDDVVKGDGLYLSLAILGATVMPHSLYLGSGLVQSRLKDFDQNNGRFSPPVPKRNALNNNNTNSFDISDDDDEEELIDSHGNIRSLSRGSSSNSNSALEKFKRFCGIHNLKDENEEDEVVYKPSLDAINDAMSYTISELLVSLFTVALFVNAAILIVSGSALSNPMDDDGDGDLESADLFTIHYLLSNRLSKTAGTVFALALLCSGQSAGVVCTLAGQMVSEGFLKWSIPPALRRIMTRAIAITPCIILVIISGREGLSSALNASQVILSLLLPFVSAPLIYFTCSKKIMRVKIDPILDSSHINGGEIGENYELETIFDDSNASSDNINPTSPTNNTIPNQTNNTHNNNSGVVLYKDMSNGILMTITSVLIWGFISFLNFWLLFNMAIGKDMPH